MPYHIIVSDSSSNIVGSGGPDAVGTPATGHTLQTIPKSKFDQINSIGLTAKDGRYRFQFNATTLDIDQVSLGSAVFLISYETATGNVTGTMTVPWTKADKLGFVFNGGPGRSIYQATEAEFTGFKQKERWLGSATPRWKVLAGVLTEQTDSRAIIRFTPNIVEAEVRSAPAPTVEVAVVDAAGDVRTGVNATRRLTTRNGRRLSVTVTNGIGSITVPTAKERQDQIVATSRFAVVTPLIVDIYEVEV